MKPSLAIGIGGVILVVLVGEKTVEKCEKMFAAKRAYWNPEAVNGKPAHHIARLPIYCYQSNSGALRVFVVLCPYVWTLRIQRQVILLLFEIFPRTECVRKDQILFPRFSPTRKRLESLQPVSSFPLYQAKQLSLLKCSSPSFVRAGYLTNCTSPSAS